MPESPQPPSGPAELEELMDRLIAEADSPEAALKAIHKALAGDIDLLPERQPPTLQPRRERAAFVVRVDLDHMRPPIWRRLRVDSHLTLADFHDVLQTAMGWTNSHLHAFLAGPGTRSYDIAPFVTEFDISEGETGIPEAEVRLEEVLSEVGDRLYYEYDFGDGWQHTIKLEKVEEWDDDAPAALCLAGKRACPPEDVGGVGGYAYALDALAGRAADDPEWAAQIVAWMPDGFDPEAFDVDAANQAIAAGPFTLDGWNDDVVGVLRSIRWQHGKDVDTLVAEALQQPEPLSDEQVAAALRRYTVLLRRVGDGVKLTAAGYLPPAVVRELWDALGAHEEAWIRRGSREEQTYPVLALRESATQLGLLRKYRGQLGAPAAVKRIMNDPRALLEHIARKLPVGKRKSQRDAGSLALLFAAAGRDWWSSRAQAAQMFEAMGWTSDGPLESVTFEEARPTWEVLNQLGAGGTEIPDPDVVRTLLLRR